MFKYKWTPFQLLALYAIAISVYDSILLTKMKGEPGLGGLFPFIYISFGLGLFITDSIFQYLLRKHEKVFFITEALLSLIFVVWIYSDGGI